MLSSFRELETYTLNQNVLDVVNLMFQSIPGLTVQVNEETGEVSRTNSRI